MISKFANFFRNFISSRQFWLLPLLYLVFLFVMSSFPADSNDKISGIYLPEYIQNMLHLPLFSILTALWIKAFINRGIKIHKAFVYAIAISLFYALFEELFQHFIPGRFADLQDIILDFLGCFAAVYIYKFFLSRKQAVII